MVRVVHVFPAPVAFGAIVTHARRSKNRAGPMDMCKAIVRKVILEGPLGPHGIAKSDRADLQGSIMFSLDPDVWDEPIYPEVGQTVLLGKLRREGDGWRSKEGRFWTK